MIIEKINSLELIKLDENMYVYYPIYARIYDVSAIDIIKEEKRKDIENKTGLKVVFEKHKLVEDLMFENVQRLLSTYYLIKEK